MIQVGIIDDEPQARARLKAELTRFETEHGLKFDLQEYDCAAAYLSAAARDFDILFLDIDMPQMSGMELAEKIRQTDSRVLLIFCTNLQQFALNGYSVSALGFIVKPVQWYSFHMYMERALKVIRRREQQQKNIPGKTLLIKDGAVSRLLDAADIAYIEVQQHDLLYNVQDRITGQKSVIKNRGSMQEVTAQLSPHGFVRCSASYLVNLRCITAVSRMNVYIGQETLPIGRAYKDSFTDTFSKYIAKKGWDDPCLL